MIKPFFRINHNISAQSLRVISQDGSQLGILSLKEALEKSRAAGLDLVEIAPTAKPPVAKIVNLGKFLYQEEKKIKALAKKSKPSELKEIRLSPFIAENDFNTRIERVRQFLKDKHKVKLVVVFKGRQMGSKNFGYAVLRKANDIFREEIAVDSEPKWFGRHLQMIISPRTKTRKLKGEKNVKDEN